MPCPGDLGLREPRQPVVFSWIAPCCKTAQPIDGRKRVMGADGYPTWRCAVCCEARQARRAAR